MKTKQLQEAEQLVRVPLPTPADQDKELVSLKAQRNLTAAQYEMLRSRGLLVDTTATYRQWRERIERGIEVLEALQRAG